MNVCPLQIVMSMFVNDTDRETSQKWHASLARYYIADESNERVVARLYPYHCLRGGMRREVNVTIRSFQFAFVLGGRCFRLCQPGAGTLWKLRFNSVQFARRIEQPRKVRAPLRGIAHQQNTSSILAGWKSSEHQTQRGRDAQSRILNPVPGLLRTLPQCFEVQSVERPIGNDDDVSHIVKLH